MSANTQSGRTRNRRGLSAASPPGGWPITVPQFEMSYDAAGRFWIKFADCQGTDFITLALTEGATIQLWDVNASTMRNCLVAAGRDGEEVKITIPVTPAVADDFVWQPWQSAVRGVNGEWVSCQRIVPRP